MKRSLFLGSALSLLLCCLDPEPASAQSFAHCSYISTEGGFVNRPAYIWAKAQALLQTHDGQIFRTLGSSACTLQDRGDGFRRVAYAKTWDYHSCLVLEFNQSSSLVGAYDQQCNAYELNKRRQKQRR